ncbi:MAG: hypothetical protein U1G05_04515 [Kiritimatiellia bacterium]
MNSGKRGGKIFIRKAGKLEEGGGEIAAAGILEEFLSGTHELRKRRGGELFIRKAGKLEKKGEERMRVREFRENFYLELMNSGKEWGGENAGAGISGEFLSGTHELRKRGGRRIFYKESWKAGNEVLPVGFYRATAGPSGATGWPEGVFPGIQSARGAKVVLRNQDSFALDSPATAANPYGPFGSGFTGAPRHGPF